MSGRPVTIPAIHRDLVRRLYPDTSLTPAEIMARLRRQNAPWPSWAGVGAYACVVLKLRRSVLPLEGPLDMTLRILVCGGRDYADAATLNARLDEIHAKRGISVVIHGGARGADSLADAWAKANNVPVEAYPADWKAHGRAAGPIRNADMLVRGRPDGVVAFPGGEGSANMVAAARAAGVRVWDLRETKA